MTKKLLALHETRICGNYEDGDSERHRLLAVDTTREALRDRWNAWQKEKCAEAALQHGDQHRYLPPPFRDGERLTYPGSTGGGYSSVQYIITIEPFEQFDDPKEQQAWAY